MLLIIFFKGYSKATLRNWVTRNYQFLRLLLTVKLLNPTWAYGSPLASTDQALPLRLRKMKKLGILFLLEIAKNVT